MQGIPKAVFSKKEVDITKISVIICATKRLTTERLFIRGRYENRF